MTSAVTIISGGCQCGRVRYRFEGEPGQAEVCHCRMCQKAGGNWGLAFLTLRADSLVWTRARPSEFMSSPVVVRGFCNQCGTPLYMREDGDPDYEITIGSLDNPNVAPPKRIVGLESELDWFDGLPDLPGFRTDEIRTPAELAKLSSLQHPDHDIAGAAELEPSKEVLPWRLANERDFDRIVEMNARLNAEDPSEAIPFDPTTTRRTLAELMALPVLGVATVLEIKGDVCGYALLISFWSNELGGQICVIDELYVEPEFRSRGFATQLIHSLAGGDSSIWPRQTVQLMIEAQPTNSRAKVFYERLGFRLRPNHVLSMDVVGRVMPDAGART